LQDLLALAAAGIRRLPNINPLWCRRISVSAQSKPLHLTVASSNQGKLREYRALTASAGASIELALLPNFGALPNSRRRPTHLPRML